MTTVTLTKDITKKGLGYEIYDGASKPNEIETVDITIRVQEIAWGTKKTLIKTPYMKDFTATTAGDIDFYYVDLKNVEEAVKLRGWLDDSVETNGRVDTATDTTLTDTGSGWTEHEYINYYVKVLKFGGSNETKRITGNTTEILTIDGTWALNPTALDTYEIIYPAWNKFWQLRAMLTTGGRLDSFVIGDKDVTPPGGIEFKGEHKMDDPATVNKPAGATLEDVTAIIGPDDTGEISSPLSDVGRIKVSCALLIGDDQQNQ